MMMVMMMMLIIMMKMLMVMIMVIIMIMVIMMIMVIIMVNDEELAAHAAILSPLAWLASSILSVLYSVFFYTVFRSY